MRVLVAACGSRGDFQPLLAFAVALARRGHDVQIGGTPTFEREAAAFGIPFHSVGQDVQRILAENRARLRTPLQMVRLLNGVMLQELRAQIDAFVPLARSVDVVVAGGAVVGARTAAECANVPFRYLALTPQVLPSAHHGPILVPLNLPPWLCRTGWASIRVIYNWTSLAPFNEARARHGAPPVRSVVDHVFDPNASWIASDPELFPAPADLAVPQLGSFELPDTRPLPPEVERFLADGPAPVYFGFGSMPDDAPERTTRVIIEAARRIGVRAIISSGWAGLGASGGGDDVAIVPSLAHRTLFPRVSAVVHHGGAGTSAAAARAGVPQIVVPHAFDQFHNARCIDAAGLGVSVRRARLDPGRVAAALQRVLESSAIRTRAQEVARMINARSPLEDAVARMERDYAPSISRAS